MNFTKTNTKSRLKSLNSIYRSCGPEYASVLYTPLNKELVLVGNHN